MKEITREQAKHEGMKRYFTGKPCKRGHVCERETSSGMCVECKKIQRSSTEYKKKAREQQGRWSESNRARKNEISRLSHRKCNPDGRSFCSVSSFIRGSLSRVISNYKGTRAKGESLCGYTADELKLHIESLWLEGMSWDNRSDWHIDHIKSVKSFKDEGITDPKIVNALSNLQPLWAADNLKKGG